MEYTIKRPGGVGREKESCGPAVGQVGRHGHDARGNNRAKLVVHEWELEYNKTVRHDQKKAATKLNDSPTHGAHPGSTNQSREKKEKEEVCKYKRRRLMSGRPSEEKEEERKKRS